MSIVALNTYNEYYKKPSSYIEGFERMDEDRVTHDDFISYVHMSPHFNEVKVIELGCEKSIIGKAKVRGTYLNRRQVAEQNRILVVVHETSIKDIFESSLQKWKDETRVLSSFDKIILNKHYQRIIGLGTDALPYIFKEYIVGSGPWHNALEAITGENPVTSECIGRSRKIKEAWIEWAKNKGYL